MLARVSAVFIAVTSALVVMTFSVPGHASDRVGGPEFTDLLDAADDLDDGDPDTYNPWDFHIEPSFSFDYTRAQITREAPCVPDNHPSITEGSGEYNRLADENPRLVEESDRCDDRSIITNREMRYQGARSTLDLTLRAGLYKDLELRANVPYVVSSTRGLKYDDEPRRGGNIVDETNSSVDPSDDDIRDYHTFNPDRDYQDPASAGAYTTELDRFQMYRFMDLDDEYSRYERTGIGDPSVGLHWAPWNDYRDDTKATMLLGFDYVMPIAPIQRHDNDAVGEGVHELSWTLRSSKRFDWIEPYFGAEYSLPIAATDSLYGRVHDGGDEGAGQVLTNPPHEGNITIGTEFIPHENPATGARYGIDVRFEFGYTSEGRDYTPLFDHMTAPDNECNNRTIESVQPRFDDDGTLINPGDVACGWVIQQPSNSSPETYDLQQAVEQDRDREFAFTDLMSVDDYGTFTGKIGAYLQPTEYFQFRATASLTHHQSHLLTTARTGSDTERTDSGSVDMSSEYERNPAYNPAYDNSGDRFRIERYNSWNFGLTTAVQF